jgi:quercetin dioxygenase-like cupin family protein
MPPNRQTALRRPQAERRVPRLAALPRPVLARVEALAPGAWSAPHTHPWGQLSYAIEGVLQVETADGCFLAPPERAVWVPAALAHSIHNIGPAQMRSLYVQAGTPGLPTQCQVLEISPLLRELVLAVCGLPEHYDEAGPRPPGGGDAGPAGPGPPGGAGPAPAHRRPAAPAVQRPAGRPGGRPHLGPVGRGGGPE